jgi:hypothetical protein
MQKNDFHISSYLKISLPAIGLESETKNFDNFSLKLKLLKTNDVIKLVNTQTVPFLLKKNLNSLLPVHKSPEFRPILSETNVVKVKIKILKQCLLLFQIISTLCNIKLSNQ